MAFTGKLEEIPLPDLLQILSNGGKSGKLTLTRRDGHGIVVFRRGRIIYAASSSARETLGNLLLTRNLLSEQNLLKALELQQKSPDEKRLGTVLIEAGLLQRETLEEAVTHQVEKVIAELLDWQAGFFHFNLVEVADRGEVEVDARGFLLREGVSPEEVLLKVAAELDALERDRREEEEAAAADRARAEEPAAATTAVPEAAAPAPAPTAPPEPGELSSLRTLMSEIRSPEFTGELTIKIMAYAAQVVNRAVLFYVRRGHFCGMGQFGIEIADGSPDESVREIRIPLDAPSILADVANRKESYRGPLPETELNRSLLDRLGGVVPREIVALPLVVNSIALLILYGDTAPENAPIGSITELELLMLQAGLAMEKNLLEKRLEHFETLRATE